MYTGLVTPTLIEKLHRGGQNIYSELVIHEAITAQGTSQEVIKAQFEQIPESMQLDTSAVLDGGIPKLQVYLGDVSLPLTTYKVQSLKGVTGYTEVDGGIAPTPSEVGSVFYIRGYRYTVKSVENTHWNVAMIYLHETGQCSFEYPDFCQIIEDAGCV